MGESQHNCQCSWKKGLGFAAGHDSHSIPATKACMYNDSWKTSSITSWCQEPPASVGVRWCDVWSFPLHSTPISANDGTMIGMIGKVARFFMSHMQIWFTDPITFMTFPTRLPNNSFHLFHPLHPCLVGVRILAHVQRWNQDQYPAAVAPPKCSSPQRWGVEGLRFTPTKFRRMPIDWRFEKGLHTKRTPLGSGNSHHPNRLHSSLPCITSMLIVVPFWGGSWPSWKASQMVKVDRACYYYVVAGLVSGPFFEPSERIGRRHLLDIDGDLPLHDCKSHQDHHWTSNSNCKQRTHHFGTAFFCLILSLSAASSPLKGENHMKMLPTKGRSESRRASVEICEILVELKNVHRFSM